MIDFIQEIYGTIKRNKLRTFLTGFSVAWGIFMLIVLLGAGNGLINAFEKNSRQMAMNSVKIFPGWTTKPYKGLKEGRAVKLTEDDINITEGFTNYVESAGGTIYQGNVNISYGEEYVSSGLDGVMPDYVKSEPMKIVKGRFINLPDNEEKRKVIVLHKKTTEILFGKDTADVVGKHVNVDGFAYRIVGVYNDDRSFSTRIFVPFSTLRLIYNKGDKLDNIIFLTKNLETEESNDAFEVEYRKAIGAHHSFSPDDTGAIWIWNRLKEYIQQQKAKNILNTAIWIIGLLTLLSGVVGVSNIMLITVKERTHEFGIRKALGAKPFSILRLIIAESVVITAIFGYIGMVAGIAATEYMSYVSGAQVMNAGAFSFTFFENPTVQINVAVQATVVLIIAGTLAGFFPARKAVMIRPIEALRAD